MLYSPPLIIVLNRRLIWREPPTLTPSQYSPKEPGSASENEIKIKAVKFLIKLISLLWCRDAGRGRVRQWQTDLRQEAACPIKRAWRNDARKLIRQSAPGGVAGIFTRLETGLNSSGWAEREHCTLKGRWKLKLLQVFVLTEPFMAVISTSHPPAPIWSTCCRANVSCLVSICVLLTGHFKAS